ncbi:MAG: sulfurtransferase complex subunit TusB [Gammaproteobacteria bacterium]|nr:sulfurtransferase complex subunit TusB [Gammaproteobacteria bacterium]
MTLHIVSKSPGYSNALMDCADSFVEGDILLLIEDGVYALSSLPENIPVQAVHYLKADVNARGIVVTMEYQGIDDTRWVELCCQQNPVVSWFK